MRLIDQLWPISCQFNANFQSCIQLYLWHFYHCFLALSHKCLSHLIYIAFKYTLCLRCLKVLNKLVKFLLYGTVKAPWIKTVYRFTTEPLQIPQTMRETDFGSHRGSTRKVIQNLVLLETVEVTVFCLKAPFQVKTMRYLVFIFKPSSG